jgi:hypothetical protein
MFFRLLNQEYQEYEWKSESNKGQPPTPLLKTVFPGSNARA